MGREGPPELSGGFLSGSFFAVPLTVHLTLPKPLQTQGVAKSGRISL